MFNILPDGSDKFVRATTFNDIFQHSFVTRYHTENTRPQKLAEHSFRVTLTAVKMMYAYNDWLVPRGIESLPVAALELEIYRYGLLHEVSELDFGDVPSHVKNKILERHNVDWNAIAEQEHWAARGLDHVQEPTKLAKAFVSIADTLEGRLLAYHHIPEGDVRNQVLEDWSKIWHRKMDRFLAPKYIHPEYRLELGKYYSANLYVDKAWV